MMNVVNNLPEYAKGYKYIVARECEGELWFWGAWDDRNKANEIALEVGGVTLVNED